MNPSVQDKFDNGTLRTFTDKSVLHSIVRFVNRVSFPNHAYPAFLFRLKMLVLNQPNFSPKCRPVQLPSTFTKSSGLP